MAVQADSDDAALANARESIENRVSDASGAGVEVIFPKPNPLRSFSSYSYVVSLYRIKKSNFNRIAQGKSLILDANDLLISSSGAPESSGPPSLETQNRFFSNTTFHIDNISMNSLIGITGRNRNTNLTELNFTIFEPYGVSLLERLILANQELGEGTYLEQPYILELKFLGYDDNGTEVNQNQLGAQVKYIPMRITDIQFEVGTQGAEYRIEAIPYNHQGYDTLRNIIPFNIEVVSSNVQEFFNSKIDIYTDVSEERDFRVIDTRPETSKKREQFKGLSDALNEFERKKKSDGYQDVADEYEFSFDSEFATATFSASSLLEESTVPMERNNFDGFSQSTGSDVDIDKSQKAFVVNLGTSITELINLILRRSTYMTNQIRFGRSGQADAIKWWKIIPIIELKEFDRKRKQYGKKITFVVKYLPLRGRNIEAVGKKMPDAAHKVYDYIFTGRNEDVLNFNMSLNAMYYQARSIIAKETKDFASNNLVYYPNNANEEELTSTNLAPTSVFYHNSYETNAVINSQQYFDNIVAGDIMRQLLNNSVDMLEIKIDILGDPDYIDTSNYFLPNSTSDYSTKIYFPDGSINYNSNECYLDFSLKTPVDYNSISGEMDIITSNESTLVSGIYRLVEVETTFSRGHFTQQLTAFRLPNPINNTIAAISAYGTELMSNAFDDWNQGAVNDQRIDTNSN